MYRFKPTRIVHKALLHSVVQMYCEKLNIHLQLFEARQQWLSGCDEMAGWLERTAQNVLQLEHSREGVVWSHSAGVDKNSFVECSALLQQRQYMVAALDAAKEQVRPTYSLTALLPPHPSRPGPLHADDA